MKKEVDVDELKEKGRAILANSRCQLLNRSPFIGSVAMSLDLIPIRDKRCSTACTDGRSIYFDLDFLSKLTPPERVFVVGHEVWHNVMLHFVRLENREERLFNVATDLEVNQLLKKDGFVAPKMALFPKAFDLPEDLNAEKYYELLLKKRDKAESQKSLDKHVYAGRCDGCGSSSDETSDGGSDGESSGTRKDKWGEVGFDEDFNPCPSKKSAEEIRAKVVDAAMKALKERGTLPEGIKAIIDDILNSEMPWNELLYSVISSSLASKSNWNKPSRRFAWSNTYLPSHSGESLKVAVGIDTSGSTACDLSMFLGELNGIVKSFGSYELHLIQCDAKVHSHEVYSDDNPLDLEHDKIEIKGCGGTTLHPIFKHIEENSLDVDTIVIFTDGCCEDFPANDDPGVDTLWVLSSKGYEKNFKFGRVAHFKHIS